MSKKILTTVLAVSALSLSRPAASSAATFLEEQAAALNGAGWAGEAKVGDAPKDIPDSKTSKMGVEESSTSLQGVAAYVLTRATASLPANVAERFGMPGQPADLVMHFINLAGEGRTRTAIMVVQRPRGQIEVIMIVVTQNDGSYYYHGSGDGTVDRGFHVTDGRWTEESADDTRTGWNQYRAFWQDWVRRNSTPTASSSGGSSGGTGGR